MNYSVLADALTKKKSVERWRDAEHLLQIWDKDHVAIVNEIGPIFFEVIILKWLFLKQDRKQDPTYTC